MTNIKRRLMKRTVDIENLRIRRDEKENIHLRKNERK